MSSQTRQVLENHDSGKRYKIWPKLHCSSKVFSPGTPLTVDVHPVCQKSRKITFKPRAKFYDKDWY